MAGGCQVAYASAGRLAFLFLDGLNVEGLYHEVGVCVCFLDRLNVESLYHGSGVVV